MSRDTNVLLETTDLTVRYGGTVANDAVNVKVCAGEIVGLIGPNGAGKTTFVDAVSGFTKASGAVTLSGSPVQHMKPHTRRVNGLARTWQAGELFADLTVEENLTVAVRRSGLKSLAVDLWSRGRPKIDAVGEMIELLSLEDVADRVPPELPLGRQRLVGIGRALVGGTTVVLLDEPAAGLDTHESAEFADDMRRIVAGGVGALLIDHDMSLVMNVCDYIYVMDFGKIIASGTPAAIQEDPRVVAAYLGVADHEALAE